MMIWEVIAIILLTPLLVFHFYCKKRYSDRIEQVTVDMGEAYNNDTDPTEDGATGTRMLVQAKTDYENNKYALAVLGACCGVLAVMIALVFVGLADMGWMALMLLPLPACISYHHFCNIFYPKWRKPLSTGF